MDVATSVDIAIDVVTGLATLGLLYVLLRITDSEEKAGAQMELIVGVAVAGVAAHFISSAIGIPPVIGWAVLAIAVFFLAGA